MSNCDDPPFLPIGTEVSSRFKGAYCESKVTKIDRDVKIKVALKEPPFGTKMLSYADVPPALMKFGAIINVSVDKKIVKGQIKEIKDKSSYYVVFNDNDKTKLRRTQLVIKSGRHYAADVNLDAMPLTNPEVFSAPVKKRGTPKKGRDEPSTSRRDEEDDEEEEEEAKTVPSTPTRQGRRRAAENARLAMGGMRGVINDTQSDESADEKPVSVPSTPRTRTRRRRVSTAEEDAQEAAPDEDEADQAGPSTSSARNAKVNAKEQKKKKEKEEEKAEQIRLKKAENDERNKQKEERQKKRQEEKALIAKQKRFDKLFKTAAESALKRHKNSLRRLLYRKSVRYSLRNRDKRTVMRRQHDIADVSRSSDESFTTDSDSDKSERSAPSRTFRDVYSPKSFVIRNRYRIRNVQLYLKWRSLSERLKNKGKCKFFRQWRSRNEEDVIGMLRGRKLLNKKDRRKCIRNWFKRVEHEKRVQFVVVHENYSQGRRLLRFIDRNGDDQRDFNERSEMLYEDIECATVLKHFKEEKWYPAILFSQVYNVNGYRQRVIRNMVSGELKRVWEDDLVPIMWIPDFNYEETNAVIQRRARGVQAKFRFAWRFSTDYVLERFHIPTFAAMLRCRRREFVPLRRDLRIPATTDPQPRNGPIYENPVEEDDAREESSDSDYDSDASIKKDAEERRDVFIAKLLQFHDTRNNTDVDVNPVIQGQEVNLYYLHELSLKIGNPKKVISANPWTKWSKKLIPNAVNPEKELRRVFDDVLEPFITLNTKMPFGTLQPRSERKQVLPGQYSENRKRRQQALDQAKPSTSAAIPPPASPTPSQATSTGKAKGVAQGSGRKRKAGTPESGSERKRGSRNTTLSPGPSEDRDVAGPSNAAYSDTDDDNQSQQGDENPLARRKRKKSRTPASKKSGNSKDETVVAAKIPGKKGRPRNSTTKPKQNKLDKFNDTNIAKKDDTAVFVRANILSNLKPFDSLKAWYEGTWYNAHCMEVSPDQTDKVKAIMAKVQKRPDRSLTESNMKRLTKLFDEITAKAHYTGWNGRFDEVLTMDYIKVKADDQKKARKRFAKLPNGRKLRPSTMASIEEKMCQEDEADTKPDYRRLAEEALGPEPNFESDYDEDVEEVELEDSEEEEEEVEGEEEEEEEEDEEEVNNTPARIVNIGDSSSEEESDEEDVPENDVVAPESPRRRVVVDDHSPELGERSLTPSSKSSVSSTSVVSSPASNAAPRAASVPPESPEKSVKSEESDAPNESRRESIESTQSAESVKSEVKESRQTTPLSPELGVNSSDSSRGSRSRSPRQRAATPAADEAGEADFDNPTPAVTSPHPPRVLSKEASQESSPEPENVGESTEAGDSDGSKSTVKDGESEPDEPEYPQISRKTPTPTPPEAQEPAAPQAPLDHLNSVGSSAGSSNYTTLSRQGSSTTVPLVSPATTLVLSGPLTLEEVPAATSSSALDGNDEDEEVPETESVLKRRRIPSNIAAEPSPNKRIRRASERSAGGTDDILDMPKRQAHLLTPHISSGALTLEMAKPESSGPIEPVTVNKGGRRRTVITASPTLNSSGPLTLPSPPTTSTAKVRPPGAPPLGRPKKNSNTGTAASRKTEERDTPAEVVVEPHVVVDERVSEESSSTTEEKDEEMVAEIQNEPVTTPRGGFSGRGGKRKRGGRFGGNHSTRTPQGKAAAASRKNTQEEPEEKEAEEPEPVVAAAPSTPVISATPTRPDSFANQKMRMAKLMEENGTSQDFHLINMDHEKVLRESPPEDININLEEMSNEAREIYLSAKSELQALEKAFRKSEAARKREAELALLPPQSSSSEDQEASSTPPTNSQ